MTRVTLITFGSIALVLSAFSASQGEGIPRDNKQVMTVANRSKDGIKIVDVVCDGSPSPNHCIISGTNIYRSAQKPMGALGDPADTCYVEIGQTEISVQNRGGDLVSFDGPGGACETTIIDTINFAQRRYSYRVFSNRKTGALCSAQPNEITEYTQVDSVLPQKSLRCEKMESIPSLWVP